MADRPSPKYAIYAGSDETEELAPRAHGRHKELAKLTYRYRRDPGIAQKWEFPTEHVAKLRERQTVLQVLADETEGKEAERYENEIEEVAAKLADAAEMEPLGFEEYLRRATKLVFALDEVDLSTLDAEATQRGISDFLYRCRGTSLQQEEESETSLNGLGDFLNLMQGTEAPT